MKREGRYRMVAHVDEVEEKIKERIEDCKRCKSIAEDTLKDVDGRDSGLLKIIIYDYDTQLLLFDHLLNTITMWRSTVCITEEKLM